MCFILFFFSVVQKTNRSQHSPLKRRNGSRRITCLQRKTTTLPVRKTLNITIRTFPIMAIQTITPTIPTLLHTIKVTDSPVTISRDFRCRTASDIINTLKNMNYKYGYFVHYCYQLSEAVVISIHYVFILYSVSIYNI